MKTKLSHRFSCLIIALGLWLSSSAQQAKDECFCSALKFAWGVDFAGAVDMTGHNMSSITFNGAVGISVPYMEFLGVGVGTEITVSHSFRSYPIFTEVRTSFQREPKLLFFDARFGCSINYLHNDTHQTGLYFSAGPGIHLAKSKKFDSYLQFAYTLMTRRDEWEVPATPDAAPVCYPYPSIHFASIRLGVTF